MNGYTYRTRLDDLEIDVLRVSVSQGQRVGLHEFPKRDGGEGEPGGRAPWVGRVEVEFFDHLDERDGASVDRFEEFGELVGDGELHTFVHPYEGAIRGWISNFDHDADGEIYAIHASFTFTEEISAPPVFTAGAGVQFRVGAQDVRSAADLARLEIEAAGLEVPGEIGEASSLADSWDADPGITGRSVFLGIATINNRLGRALDRLNVRSNLARHPIHKQVTLLQYTLRRAGAAFRSSDARITTITVREPMTLRVLAASVYGASQAERRVREIRELNPTVTTSSLIPAGVQLKAYAPLRRRQ